MKENKEAFRSKKINRLTIEDLTDLKKYLENCDQVNSTKYRHVIERMQELVNARNI